MSSEEKKVIKIEVTPAQYAALEELARQKGYQLVSDFVRAIIAEVTSGEAQQLPSQGPSDLAESISRRLERRIEDLLNPFTGKIDEVNRRLGELLELVEGMQQPRPSSEEYAEGPPAREERIERQQRAEKGRRASAIERLREQKVVFYSDVGWMRAPEKLFQKLERDGAIVFTAAGERVGVDPEYWGRFKKLLDEISIGDPEEVGTLLSARLGEQARRLFNVLLRGGLAYYDRDQGSWTVRVQGGGGG